MNKLYIILSVAAFVALASAHQGEVENELESELPSYDDDQEVAYLKPETRVFEDFCIEARDEVMNFMKTAAKGKSSAVFAAIFGAAHQSATEILNVESKAVQEGAELIQGAAVQPASKAADDIEKSLQETIQNVSILTSVKGAVRSVLTAVIDTARSEFFQKLSALRANFSPDAIKQMLQEACHTITDDLNVKLNTKLEATKEAFSKSSGNDFSRYTTANVGCVTAGRVAKASAACEIVRLAAPALYPLFGY